MTLRLIKLNIYSIRENKKGAHNKHGEAMARQPVALKLVDCL